MRAGIGSYTYGWAAAQGALTPQTLLEKAEALGVGVVQIADNMPLAALAPPELDSLARSAASKGITLEVGARGLTEENALRYIAICERLSARLLRMVNSAGEYMPDADEAFSIIKTVLPAAKRSGVTIAIENHECTPASELKRLIERCDSPNVGICLDTANSLGAGEGLETVAASLAEHTVNLHVKDFTIQRLSYQMGFTVIGAAAGEGMLDIPRLAAQVSAHKPDITAVIELWTPPEAEMAQTLAKEDLWARRSVAYLQGVLRGGN